MLSESDLHLLVSCNRAPLSQPGHMEGPEGGQPGHRLELQCDHTGPQGGREAAACNHQNAEVSRQILG